MAEFGVFFLHTPLLRRPVIHRPVGVGCVRRPRG